MAIMVEVPEGKVATITGPARFSVITDVPGSVLVDDISIEPPPEPPLEESPAR